MQILVKMQQWLAILVSGKVYFRAKKINRAKKDVRYVMIKGSRNHEDIALINVYAPNKKTFKYKKQKVIEPRGEIDNFTTIVGDFNTLLTRYKVSKDIEHLSNTINQFKLIDIYTMFHPRTAEYTSFPSN